VEAEKLFRKALEERKGLSFLNVNVGRALFALGRTEEAIDQYGEAIRIDAKDFNAWNNAGVALLHLARTNEAITAFQKAVEIVPGNAMFQENLARLLAETGHNAEAIQMYRNRLQHAPGDATAHHRLARLLFVEGKMDEAVDHGQQAVRLKPDFVDARFDLAEVYAKQSRTADAVEQWRELLKLAPDRVEVLGNLAWALATSRDATLRNGNEAVALAERARALAPTNLPTLSDLAAAAYAEAGRFDDAEKSEAHAIRLAAESGQSDLAEKYRTRVRMYRARQPFRD
jgi:Flp pilus assembly protein TadD